MASTLTELAVQSCGKLHVDSCLKLRAFVHTKHVTLHLSFAMKPCDTLPLQPQQPLHPRAPPSTAAAACALRRAAGLAPPAPAPRPACHALTGGIGLTGLARKVVFSRK